MEAILEDEDTIAITVDSETTEYFKYVKLIQNRANMTLAKGTVIKNGYSITLPIYYVVGSKSLELYLDGALLTPKTDSNEDGHYVEVGDEGEESTKIQFYRTDDDGNYTLQRDANLDIIVKGMRNIEEEE